MTLIEQSIGFIHSKKRKEKLLILLGIPMVFGVILGLSILFIPSNYLLFVIGGLIFTYLALFKIEVAIIITLLLQNQLSRFNYLGGDTPFHPNGIIGLLLIAGSAFYFFTHKVDYSRLKAIWGFLVFILVSAFSLISAGKYLMDGITILLRLVAAFSIFAVLCHKLETSQQVKWILGVILAAQVLPTISGIIGSSRLTSIFVFEESMRIGDSGVGVYLSAISLLCVTYFLNSKRLKSFIGWGALTALFLAGLFFSFGRSGWIGFAFGLILMAAIRFKKLIFIIPLILILTIALVPAIGQRFEDIKISDLQGKENDTLSGRIRLWQAGFAVFKDNPVLGVGIGLGKFQIASHLGRNPGAIHNDYLSALVETGVIGFIIFITWHYQWLKTLIDHYQMPLPEFERTTTFAVLIVFTSIMVMRFTDNILLDTYDMYPLCALLAAAFELPRIVEQESQKK